MGDMGAKSEKKTRHFASRANPIPPCAHVAILELVFYQAVASLTLLSWSWCTTCALKGLARGLLKTVFVELIDAGGRPRRGVMFLRMM
mmetsp:Transcript_84301/g.167400  ORF Transcript_84301/g.167400 Transcript_84301/m.167400 type:complete len:88 (+) Transcript_84301:1406-1669(+)